MVEEKKKGLVNEDWLAFYLAIALIIISFLSYFGVDPFGWTVKTS
ncbi:hypothetical protein EcB171_5634, partial [Escherichia coli B171]